MHFFPLMCFFPLWRESHYIRTSPLPKKSQLYLLLVKLLICSDSPNLASRPWKCMHRCRRYAAMYLCLAPRCDSGRRGSLSGWKDIILHKMYFSSFEQSFLWSGSIITKQRTQVLDSTSAGLTVSLLPAWTRTAAFKSDLYLIFAHNNKHN